jgi:hypothetical protein
MRDLRPAVELYKKSVGYMLCVHGRTSMRGLPLLVTVSAGVALLTGCNGSEGTGFLTGSPTAIVSSISFSGDSGELAGTGFPPTFPLALQSAKITDQVPLALVATAYTNTGSTQAIVPGALFTWSAATKTCGGTPSTTYASGSVPLDYVDPTGSQDPAHSGYSIMGAATTASTAFVFPPDVPADANGGTVPAAVDYPTGFPPAAGVTPAAGTGQYCLTVTATAASGVSNSATVTVIYP